MANHTRFVKALVRRHSVGADDPPEQHPAFGRDHREAIAGLRAARPVPHRDAGARQDRIVVGCGGRLDELRVQRREVATGGGGEDAYQVVALEACVARPAAVVVVTTLPRDDEDRWHMSVEQLRRPVPFTAPPMIETSPDGSRFAWLITDIQGEHGGTFTVTMFDADGATLFVRSYPFRGIPVPAQARDSVLDAMIPAPDR